MFWSRSWLYVCFFSTLIFSRNKLLPSPLTGLCYVSEPASEWCFLFCGEKVRSLLLICTFYHICTVLHCFLLICVVVRGGGPGCGLWRRTHGVEDSAKLGPTLLQASIVTPSSDNALLIDWKCWLAVWRELPGFCALKDLASARAHYLHWEFLRFQWNKRGWVGNFFH